MNSRKNLFLRPENKRLYYLLRYAILVFVAVLSFVFAIAVRLGYPLLPPKPLNAATLSPDSLKRRQGLYLKDAVIADVYGCYTAQGLCETLECVVVARVRGVADGSQKAAFSLKVPMSNPHYQQIMAYLEDDNARVGDLTMDLYVTTALLGNDFARFFQDYAADLNTDSIAFIPLELHYRGTTEEEYIASVRAANIKSVSVSLALLAAGGISLRAYFVLVRKKSKA